MPQIITYSACDISTLQLWASENQRKIFLFSLKFIFDATHTAVNFLLHIDMLINSSSSSFLIIFINHCISVLTDAAFYNHFETFYFFHMFVMNELLVDPHQFSLTVFSDMLIILFPGFFIIQEESEKFCSLRFAWIHLALCCCVFLRCTGITW